MVPERRITRGGRTVGGLVLAVALGWGGAGLAQQSQAPSTPTPADSYRSLAPRVKATLRFETDLPLTPEGPTFHVKVYTWHIAPQQDLPSFPLEGAATIEVRAGEVQTTIDGQTVERREGDHWAVAEGARLRLKTGNDSVSLQGVVVVRR
jgi:quercetin dioxygenase-like cupin family protein